MDHFSNWVVEFFKTFFLDLWYLISGFFTGIYNLFIGYPIEYYHYLMDKSINFNLIDWILSIGFIIIFILLYVMTWLIIVQLVKRYFRFSKIEFDKMTLLNQMNMLERKVRDATVIHVEGPKLNLNDQKGKPKLATGSRFTKLNLIDDKYKYTVLPTLMTNKDKLSLSEIVTHFINYASSHHNIYYSEKIASTFIAGLATSKILILEGISGTGKTSLPYVFGKFIKNDASIISVQPSWRDRFEMMGYYNEFTKKFNETEFLTSLYDASYRTDINLIVLDEMNLARVEYYFADFLSLLELPNSDEWLIEVVPEQLIGDPIHLKEGQLQIPKNVWFIGTANNDDSTFGITDKVYDRASSIVMNEKAKPFKGQMLDRINISYDYLDELFKTAYKDHEISNKNLVALEKLDEFISETFQITFGNRIMNQLYKFIPIYVACGRSEIEGIDYIIARKIIRKFETLNLPFLKNELETLLQLFDQLFGKNQLKESKDMILKFIKQI